MTNAQAPDYRAVTADELLQIKLGLDLEPRDGQDMRVCVNMVQSFDGVTTIPQRSGAPRETGLGHPLDLRLMRYYRAHADCVLNGATTLENSGADALIEEDLFPELIGKRKELGKSPAAYAAVVTSAADFAPHIYENRFFRDARFDSILFVSADAPEENLERVRRVVDDSPGKKLDVVRVQANAQGRIDLSALLQMLRESYAVRVLLVEGGATLNGALVRERAVTDFFLSVAPKLAIKSSASRGIIDGPTTLYQDELIPTRLVSSYWERTSGMEFKHYAIL